MYTRQPGGVPLDVGVKELRDHLRQWLDAVQHGEEITVTERGKPVARLVRASGPSAYQRLVAQGVITPAKRPKRPAGSYPHVRVDGSLSDIVLEQRT
jgi:prevent-host-death family protein